MAILKSDEVQEYIVNDKKILQNFETFILKINKSFFKEYFQKIKKLIIIF